VRPLSVCGALDETDLLKFELIARHVHLAPNEALFTTGQPASSVHNMTSGVARLYKLLPDGRRQVLGFALPGDFLELAPSDRYNFSAFAARELMLAQEQMLLLGRRSSEEKVASFLISWRNRLADIGDVGETIALPMSRQDIADYLGLTIETVSRTLTRFEREKLLVIVRGGVRLVDQHRAEALAAA
jgi:CRP/FNR family transcriptional regulator, anaerobic regulatory protein